MYGTHILINTALKGAAMFGIKRFLCSGITLLPLSLLASSALAGEILPSTEVQNNISILQESNKCPQCDLREANLNRLDLTGANLEGANLSRAKMFLTDFSNANLRNTDLREAKFGGADLAGADLRGADLAGASLDGAYMQGTLLDGEMVSTRPYAQDGISSIEKDVYVEDTVNSKTPPESKDLNVNSQRTFEDAASSVPEVKTIQQQSETISIQNTPVENVRNHSDDAKATLPKPSAVAPAAKVTPAIHDVRIQEEAKIETLPLDESQKDSVNINISKENFQKPEENDNSGGTEMSGSTVESSVAQAQTVSEETIVDGSEAQQSAKNEVENVKGAGKQAGGVIQSVLNMFSSPEEPSSEIMRNVAVLLDTNQCYGCNLSGVNLSGENLDDSDLEGADLSNAILTKVGFEGANLKGTNLSDADLSGADLSEADLYKADLTGANLTGAKLEDTLLDDVDLSSVKGYQQTLILLNKE